MPGITPDFSNEYTITQARDPAALTADANTSGIDLNDHAATVTVFLTIGAVTGTTPTLTVTAQSSKNDNSADASGAADAYTAITNGATSELTDSDANSVVVLQFHTRNERYVRLNFDVGGTNPSFLVGALVVVKKVS